MNETPEEGQLPEVFSVSIQKPALLMEHLNDLRKHLFRIMVVVAVCVAVMFAFTPDLVNFLALPIGGLDELTAIDVTESVSVFMRVAFMGALTIASPYIAFELWWFAAPGLMPRERKSGLVGIPLVLAFFIGGIVFSYYLLLPTALPFLLNFMGIEALPRVSSYINFVTGILFWMGVAFEFPLVVYILTIMGLLQPSTLAHGWRIAVVIIAVAAAVITPTPDPINMSIVMAPLLILYVISIGLSFVAAIGRKKKAQAR
ncbi:MAG: twin-arginine translocase subunit TatC [Chloroflexi bacterium]|nr:twin-arginine translocase subunit TatC [Chloroflexota bacterium]